MRIGTCLAVAVLAAAVAAAASCSSEATPIDEKKVKALGQELGELQAEAFVDKAADSCCIDKKTATAVPGKSCCTEKKAADASKAVDGAKAADGCCGSCGTKKSDPELAKKHGFCTCLDKKKSE